MPPEATPPRAADRLALHLDGFEGPLDLLLDMARAQKVELARISLVALADQYIAVITEARDLSLELAADWLVMAAWLAWLKSRLLLPPEETAAEEGVEAGAALAERLAELAAMRAGAAWLADRPTLGQTVWTRGAPESFVEFDMSGIRADPPMLFRGYTDAHRRARARDAYRPRQLSFSFWTVQDALARLTATLGRVPGWMTLEAFLPERLAGFDRRAAIASTLVASLELARGGAAALRQDAPFAPILVASAHR